MKAYPLPDRSIQLEVEDGDDWRLLEQLLIDAGMEGFDPALDVSARIGDEALMEDWVEYVLPDLREVLDGTLSRVARSIDRKRKETGAGAGRVLIAADDGMDWYGVLNRARLALESRHGLAMLRDRKVVDVDVRSALLRDRLYCALQSLLLDHSLA